jgi:hypothetical protein
VIVPIAPRRPLSPSLGSCYADDVATANSVGLERVAAALHVLAGRRNADRLERIMTFVCLLLEEAARRPALFARVTTGTLVVDLRRSQWTADLVLGADDGRAFTELLACELPFVAFDSILTFVAARCADFGNAFVLLGEDVVSVSVLAEVDLDDAPPQPAAHAGLFDDDFERETTLTPRWDVDATIICTPPTALLELLAQRAAVGPAVRDPADRNTRKRR